MHAGKHSYIQNENIFLNLLFGFKQQQRNGSGTVSVPCFLDNIISLISVINVFVCVCLSSALVWWSEDVLGNLYWLQGLNSGCWVIGLSRLPFAHQRLLSFHNINLEEFYGLEIFHLSSKWAVMENDTFKGRFDLGFKNSKYLEKYRSLWHAVSAMSAQQPHCVACTKLEQCWSYVEALSAYKSCRKLCAEFQVGTQYYKWKFCARSCLEGFLLLQKPTFCIIIRRNNPHDPLSEQIICDNSGSIVTIQ